MPSFLLYCRPLKTKNSTTSFSLCMISSYLQVDSLKTAKQHVVGAPLDEAKYSAEKLELSKDAIAVLEPSQN